MGVNSIDLTAANWRCKRLQDNYLPLKEWDIHVNGKRRGHIALPVAQLPSAKASGRKAKLTFTAPFHVQDMVKNLRLLADRTTIERFSVSINGHPLSRFTACRDFDESNRSVLISPFVKKGMNSISLSTTDDPARVRHIFKEMLYLIGDHSLARTGRTYRIARDNGSTAHGLIPWHENGWPFYSGIVRYTAKITVSKRKGDRCHIVFDYPGAFAHVRVNGTDAGIVYARPYRIEISDILRDGVNTMEVDSANTLENVIEGSAAPAGIRGSVRIHIQRAR